MQFEVSRPISGPCGQKLNAFAVTLHQHQLQRYHTGTAVVEVRIQSLPAFQNQ